MFRWLSLAVLLLAVIAGLVIGVLNPEAVLIDLLAIELTLPLGALVLSALAVGVLGGLLLAFVLFVLPARLSRRRPAESKGAGQRLTDQSNA